MELQELKSVGHALTLPTGNRRITKEMTEECAAAILDEGIRQKFRTQFGIIVFAIQEGLVDREDYYDLFSDQPLENPQWRETHRQLANEEEWRNSLGATTDGSPLARADDKNPIYIRSGTPSTAVAGAVVEHTEVHAIKPNKNIKGTVTAYNDEIKHPISSINVYPNGDLQIFIGDNDSSEIYPLETVLLKGEEESNIGLLVGALRNNGYKVTLGVQNSVNVPSDIALEVIEYLSRAKAGSFQMKEGFVARASEARKEAMRITRSVELRSERQALYPQNIKLPPNGMMVLNENREHPIESIHVYQDGAVHISMNYLRPDTNNIRATLANTLQALFEEAGSTSDFIANSNIIQILDPNMASVAINYISGRNRSKEPGEFEITPNFAIRIRDARTDIIRTPHGPTSSMVR